MNIPTITDRSARFSISLESWDRRPSLICLRRSTLCCLDVEDQILLRANATKYIRTLVRGLREATRDQGKELAREDKHRGSDHVAKQSARLRLGTSVNHPADPTTNMQQRKKLSSSFRCRPRCSRSSRGSPSRPTPHVQTEDNEKALTNTSSVEDSSAVSFSNSSVSDYHARGTIMWGD